jgi:hypothetical protein
MVSSSLNMFKKPEAVNRTLEKIGHGHFKKGVKAYQYPLAGESLFATFKFCLGSAWDASTERAWHRIFSHILKEIVRIAVIDERAGEIVEQRPVQTETRLPPVVENQGKSVTEVQEMAAIGTDNTAASAPTTSATANNSVA